LMKERTTQAESLVLLRQKEEDFKRAKELHNDKVISEAQYQLARGAVDSLKATTTERSNLIERLEADLKNFALQERGGSSRSAKD